MAFFIPGSTRCRITGRLLTEADGIAAFPVFESEIPRLQKYSDAVVDYASARCHPDYQELLALFRSFVAGRSALFRNENGVIIEQRLGQGLVSFFPLLLAFNAPMTSIVTLLRSDILAGAFDGKAVRLEFPGLSFQCSGEEFVLKTFPLEYQPNDAPPDLTHTHTRRGSQEVQEFITFLRDVRSKIPLTQ